MSAPPEIHSSNQARSSGEALPAPVVVVTGGSRGLGRAIAIRFGRAGNRVVLVARDPDALRRAAADVARAGACRVDVLSLDLTQPSAPEALTQWLANHDLYADILVNCAGVGLSSLFEEQSPPDIDALLVLNVSALTRLMRSVLPQMRARRSGGVLNVASLGGVVPGPYQAAYYASKSYVMSLTEAIAFELAGSGVRVSVLAPGPIDTDFHRKMGAEGALYRTLLPALSVERAARSAYWGFRLRRAVIVPGVVNSLVYLSARILPHTLSVPLVGWLLKPRPPRRSHS